MKQIDKFNVFKNIKHPYKKILMTDFSKMWVYIYEIWLTLYGENKLVKVGRGYFVQHKYIGKFILQDEQIYILDRTEQL